MTSTKRQTKLGLAPPRTRVEWAIARYNWYRACGLLSGSAQTTRTTTHERSPDSPPPKPHLKWYPLSKPDDDISASNQRVAASTLPAPPRRRGFQRIEDTDASTILARYQAEKASTKGPVSDGQFDPSKHPRAEAGQRDGGRFVKAGEGTTAAATEPFEQHFTTPLRQHYVVSSQSEWNHKQHSGLHVPGLSRDRSEKFLKFMTQGSKLRQALATNAVNISRAREEFMASAAMSPLSVREQAVAFQTKIVQLVLEQQALQKQWSQLETEYQQAGLHTQKVAGYQEGIDKNGKQVSSSGTGLSSAVEAFDKSHSPIEGDSGWRQINGDHSEEQILADPAEATSEAQQGVALQTRIAERQSQVDALTRQQNAANSELQILKGHYLKSRATKDRIKALEAFVTFSQKMTKKYQAEINRDRASLANGQTLPELPKLTETGPGSREGSRPHLKWIKDARIMADLASASYEDATLSKAAKDLGWSKAREFRNDETGFNAVLFVNHKTGESVLGFAGTTFKDPRDLIVANGRQGLGFKDRQYEQAIQLTAQLKKKFPNLRLTGHSLGGGLASAAAIVNRIGDTVTFNAAGVHPSTVRRYKMDLSNATGLIRAFRVKGEILSTTQDARLPIPIIVQKAALRGKTISDPMPNGVGTNYWLDSGSGSTVDKHGMDHIQKGLSRPTS